MLRKIRKWLSDRKEHREDMATCRTYWKKDVKVLGDTIAYWNAESLNHQWIPFVKGMPYSYGRPLTNMLAISMSVTVVDGLGINNLLFALMFYNDSSFGNTKVYPLLVFCSKKKGLWTQPVHSAESLFAIVGKKQYAHIRKFSRINWNISEIA